MGACACDVTPHRRLAFEDAIRDFAPDHLLIGLRAGHSGWQERGLLDRLQERFGLPMTVFALPGE